MTTVSEWGSAEVLEGTDGDTSGLVKVKPLGGVVGEDVDHQPKSIADMIFGYLVEREDHVKSRWEHRPARGFRATRRIGGIRVPSAAKSERLNCLNKMSPHFLLH